MTNDEIVELDELAAKDSQAEMFWALVRAHDCCDKLIAIGESPRAGASPTERAAWERALGAIEIRSALRSGMSAAFLHALDSALELLDGKGEGS